jgi:hypothetical protein
MPHQQPIPLVALLLQRNQNLPIYKLLKATKPDWIFPVGFFVAYLKTQFIM